MEAVLNLPMLLITRLRSVEGGPGEATAGEAAAAIVPGPAGDVMCSCRSACTKAIAGLANHSRAPLRAID